MRREKGGLARLEYPRHEGIDRLGGVEDRTIGGAPLLSGQGEGILMCGGVEENEKCLVGSGVDIHG